MCTTLDSKLLNDTLPCMHKDIRVTHPSAECTKKMPPTTGWHSQRQESRRAVNSPAASRKSLSTNLCDNSRFEEQQSQLRTRWYSGLNEVCFRRRVEIAVEAGEGRRRIGSYDDEPESAP